MNDHIPDPTKMINQWTNGTEILNVKPNGDFELGNGVDPLVALGQLAKVFMQQQDRIKRLEEENDAMRADLLFDTYPQTIVRELNRMADRIKRLEEALEGTIKCFVDLADSGDAGFWNPDEQSVIIAARAALESKEAKP